MKITKRHVSVTAAKRYVRAAEEDEDFGFGDEDAEGMMDAIDDVSDQIEDIQDSLDDIDEDEVDIAANNNIADHYIAECQRCQGIFISAVLESDQEIDHITGICPLCGKETDQYLKWIIREADIPQGEDVEEEVAERPAVPENRGTYTGEEEV